MKHAKLGDLKERMIEASQVAWQEGIIIALIVRTCPDVYRRPVSARP